MGFRPNQTMRRIELEVMKKQMAEYKVLSKAIGQQLIKLSPEKLLRLLEFMKTEMEKKLITNAPSEWEILSKADQQKYIQAVERLYEWKIAGISETEMMNLNKQQEHSLITQLDSFVCSAHLICLNVIEKFLNRNKRSVTNSARNGRK